MRTSVRSLVSNELPSARPLGLRAKDAAIVEDAEGERVAANAHVARHQDRFKDEVGFWRDRAQRAREDPNAAPTPATRGEWVHEISKREERLRELMRVATAKRVS